MDKFDFLEIGNYTIFLEYRNSFNCGAVSLFDNELSFTGNFHDLIDHLERYFDYDDIVEMINDGDLFLFETYNDGQDIILEYFNCENDFDDFDKVYLKVVR